MQTMCFCSVTSESLKIVEHETDCMIKKRIEWFDLAFRESYIKILFSFYPSHKHKINSYLEPRALECSGILSFHSSPRSFLCSPHSGNIQSILLPDLFTFGVCFWRLLLIKRTLTSDNKITRVFYSVESTRVWRMRYEDDQQLHIY